MQEKLRNNGLEGCRITKHSLYGLREKSKICGFGYCRNRKRFWWWWWWWWWWWYI